MLCYHKNLKVKEVSLRLQMILIIISILLDMDIILPFPLNHPSLLLIYRYSFLRVSAKFGVEVEWHESLCVTAFLAIFGNKYCHGFFFFFFFFALTNIFMGSLFSIPLH